MNGTVFVCGVLALVTGYTAVDFCNMPLRDGRRREESMWGRARADWVAARRAVARRGQRDWARESPSHDAGGCEDPRGTRRRG